MILNLVKKGFQSAGSGMIATIVFLSVSYILDKRINVSTSNLIALLICAVINFILQSFIFLDKTLLNFNHITKYIFAEIIILSADQLLDSYLLENKKKYISYFPHQFQKYYNTIIRLIVAALVWMLIAFPLRNYWIFI